MATTKSKRAGAAFEKYRISPKSAYRAMGLGIASDGYIKVLAGFQFRWWVPDFLDPVVPVFVQARILRIHQKRDGRP